MIRWTIILSILFIIGCGRGYRRPIIGPRDPLLLIDCASPAQAEKFAEVILQFQRGRDI